VSKRKENIMSKPNTLRGVCTVVYPVADLAAAKHWYSDILGIEPYFNRPEYIEFRLGDYQHELGLLDSKYLTDIGGAQSLGNPAGVITYWYVDDAEAMFARLLELGAKPHQPPRDFGTGFIGASVIDPFGNILGIMNNPHYREVLAGTNVPL
jgi:predicted enzyme related to lactoylglutathione lyase